jgi:hypothetical protein
MFLVCFFFESCAPIRRASVQINHLYQADAGKIIFPYFATPEGANLRKSYVRKSAESNVLQTTTRDRNDLYHNKMGKTKGVYQHGRQSMLQFGANIYTCKLG